MNNITLLICFSISFFAVLLLIPIWIKRAKKGGLVGKDIHKKDKRDVAEMGGVVVIIAFLLGLLSYVALTMPNGLITEKNAIVIMGVMCSLLITTLIGVLDDVLGWKIGLRQYEKPIITLLAVVPLAVVLIDKTSIFIPFIGNVNFGLLYPLFILPAIILVTTNGFNMLAGYNGLEAGMGIIILSTLGIMSFQKGFFWPGAIAFIMVFALIGFISHNFFPATVFPGDSLTYSLGALIGIVAVTAKLEHTLLILFIPYVFEFFLKLRGKMQKESFAKLKKDGSLYVDDIYGVEHIAVRVLSKVKKKVTETNVVLLILGVQLIFGVITWAVFV